MPLPQTEPESGGGGVPASVGPELSTGTLASGRPGSTTSRSGRQEAAMTIAAAAAPATAPSQATLRPKSECTCVPLPYRAARSGTIGERGRTGRSQVHPLQPPHAKPALR